LNHHKTYNEGLQGYYGSALLPGKLNQATLPCPTAKFSLYLVHIHGTDA